nr:immunoglobulin light chain junction region [Macaca mulatta]MOW36541.1 immunoglobulin light chain junction region [Macaca mulatta]MOW36687.1 immunoglobulin light chain junction region [Macaca mulatta]MOW36932.1 immunoglobulin light chain junction region [Macaca mulatta]MOW37249.1 immunoglobulin light chain junction region [Macaca mulatta]
DYYCGTWDSSLNTVLF